MKIELHMIQNFPPACLNRDDTNSPKDCEFGGVRRARISSQCIKRAIRCCFRDGKLLPPENLAVRTNRLVDDVVKRLVEKGKDEPAARAAVEAALGGIGLALKDGRTQYLLFLSQSAIAEFAVACLKHWDELAKVAKSLAKPQDDKKKAGDAKDAKRKAKEAVPEEVQKAAIALLDGHAAADLALFGRMLADLPGHNIDAACQVAHAISTNKVSMDMDFYTAVDDLKPADDDAGAGMMGVIGYNSACFYRYAVLDLKQLLRNLDNDVELATKSVRAFLSASAEALPTGKQNTFAAHSRPDFILAVVRDGGAPLSMANAFAAPARAVDGADLTQSSIDKLADYWTRVTGVYGNGGQATFCAITAPKKAPTDWKDAGTLEALIDKVLSAAQKGA